MLAGAAIIGLAGAGFPGPATAEPVDLADLLAGIDTDSARTMAFEETRSSPLLEDDMVLTGQVRFEPPSRLERHVDRPYRESHVIIGNRVQVHRNNRRIGGFSLARSPELKALAQTLIGLLNRDVEALNENFQARAERTDDGAWKLKLVPRDAELATAVRWITVAGQAGAVDTLTIEPVEGKRIETRLEPVE